jgi:hypothetical protein
MFEASPRPEGQLIFDSHFDSHVGGNKATHPDNIGHNLPFPISGRTVMYAHGRAGGDFKSAASADFATPALSAHSNRLPRALRTADAQTNGGRDLASDTT